ncbi:MAG TPA: GNAT family N-acetyltransferase [Roseiflexaceae bacterium]|nr:GNAT family N-acetyltransferase [Roseiflexaceae bacterium]
MRLDESELVFESITEADIPELMRVMTRAFDDDAQKHLGLERGGPPGYDSGDFFRQWLFGYDETDGYKVLSAGKIIAGVIVWILPEGHNVLGTIFVDPDAQDRGVGARVWQFIEARYPATKSWRLTTPRWATKNHHFYAIKCGFARVESDPIIGSPEGEYVYRKDMLRPAAEGVDPRVAAQGED